MKQDKGFSVRYIGIVLLSVLFTWELHEFAHWLTGEVLGNNMVMTLNTGYPLTKQYLEAWHSYVVSLAGPLITLLQAVIVYFLMKRGASLNFLPMLLCCAYMRALAGIMNVINLNDEGRISQGLGLGVFTLPLIMIALLFYLNFKIIKLRPISRSVVLLTLTLIIIFSSLIILGDQFWKIRLL